MPSRTKESPAPEVRESGGGLALVAAVLAHLDVGGRDAELVRAIEALRQVLLDWQVAYKSLDAQLSLALRANEENGRMIVLLRDELRRTQARAAEAAAQAFEAQAERDRLRSELAKLAPNRTAGGSK